MKKYDFVIIIALLSISLILLFAFKFNSANGDIVTVTVNGKLFGQYSLKENQEISISQEGHNNTIIIDNNSVYMLDSDCSNKVCIEQGKITKNNESICCAPNGVIITIKSEDLGEYDAITQ